MKVDGNYQNLWSIIDYGSDSDSKSSDLYSNSYEDSIYKNEIAIVWTKVFTPETNDIISGVTKRLTNTHISIQKQVANLTS